MEQEKNAMASQLRAARAILGVSQAKLAEMSEFSSMTIKRAEGIGRPYPSNEAVKSIRAALEAAGVEFIQENGGGAGVRLKK